MNELRCGPTFRCRRCFMIAACCICDTLPKVSIHTQIAVLMHALEEKKSSNTARLLKLVVPATDLLLVGRQGIHAEVAIPEHCQPLVLFPDLNAPVLTPELVTSFEKLILLIVPDGTWTQARKLIQRRANLAKVSRVQVAATGPSRYFLRKRRVENGLCTIEAVAEALGVIEGPDGRSLLLTALTQLVEGVERSGRAVRRNAEQGLALRRG